MGPSVLSQAGPSCVWTLPWQQGGPTEVRTGERAPLASIHRGTGGTSGRLT